MHFVPRQTNGSLNLGALVDTVREKTQLELRLKLTRPFRKHDQIVIDFPANSFDLSSMSSQDCSSVFNGIGTAYDNEFPLWS